MMVTRNIKCAGCNYEGKIEAHDTVDEAQDSDLFKTLGKDPATGFLYFRCPSCNKDIAVDPFKAIAAKQMLGLPPSQLASGRSGRSNRYVPIIIGLVCIIAAILIVVNFRGWWTYIVGGLLLMFGLPSLKTGLFATDKEITELTETGPVSEETTRKLKDREGIYWKKLNNIAVDKYISKIETLESPGDKIYLQFITASLGLLSALIGPQKGVFNVNLKEISIEIFLELHTILLCYFVFLFYNTNPSLREGMRKDLLDITQESDLTYKFLQSLEKTSTKAKKLDIQQVGSKVWKEITTRLGPYLDVGSSVSQMIAFIEISVEMHNKLEDKIDEIILEWV